MAGIENPSKSEDALYPQTPYRFSPEELRVLQQCNRESFYRRSLPLGTIFGVGTYYSVQSGYLKPNIKFGAAPKVITAVILGYFIGKFSYQRICAEKLMALPNSQLGAMLRNRKNKGGFQESISLDIPSFSSLPTHDSKDVFSDSPHTYTDLDTDRPYNEGLLDSNRPSLDDSNPFKEDELPPAAPHSNTYEDLRKKNREEYEQRKTKPFRSMPASDETPASRHIKEPETSYDRQSTGPIWDAPTNKYGDVWDK